MAITSKLRLNQMKYHVGEFGVKPIGGVGQPVNLAGIAYASDAEIDGTMEEHISRLAVAHQKRFGTAAVGSNPLIDVTAGVLAHFNVDDAVASASIKNEAGEVMASASSEIRSLAGTNVFERAGQQIEMSAGTNLSGSADTGYVSFAALSDRAEFVALTEARIQSFSTDVVGEAAVHVSMSAGSDIRMTAGANLEATFISGNYIGTGDFLLDMSKEAQIEANDMVRLVNDDGKRRLEVDSLAQKIRLEELEGNMELATAISGSFISSGELRLEAASTGDKLRFDDGNRDTSDYLQGYIALSDTTADWNDFYAAFGEVSLLKGIHLASLGGTTDAADYIFTIDTVSGDQMVKVDDANGAAASTPQAATAALPCAYLDNKEVLRQVSVYLNGQKLALGDDYTIAHTAESSAGANDQEFAITYLPTLEDGDIVVVEVG